MAEVYLARTPLAQGLQKLLVIKKIHPAYAQAAQFRVMFRHSAGLRDRALILLGFLRNHLALRRYPERSAADEAAFPRQLTHAISIAVLLLLLMGWGGHNLFRYTWLWYGGFQLIALHCLKTRAAAGVEEELAFAEADEVERSGHGPRPGWGLEPHPA